MNPQLRGICAPGGLFPGPSWLPTARRLALTMRRRSHFVPAALAARLLSSRTACTSKDRGSSGPYLTLATALGRTLDAMIRVVRMCTRVCVCVCVGMNV